VKIHAEILFFACILACGAAACAKGAAELPANVPEERARIASAQSARAQNSVPDGGSSPGTTSGKSPAVAGAAGAEQTHVAASPLDVARRWLHAMREGDTSTLKRLLRYPVTLRATSTQASCSVAAKSERELGPLLDCIAGELIREDLQDPHAAHIEVASRLPNWGRKWQKKLPAELTPVRLDINGNGIRYYFVLFIRGDGVAEIWLDAYFEPG
jgi:hypothetical protein